jgi:hypothetical protein
MQKKKSRILAIEKSGQKTRNWNVLPSKTIILTPHQTVRLLELIGGVEKYHSVVEIDDRRIAIDVDMSIDGRSTMSLLTLLS